MGGTGKRIYFDTTFLQHARDLRGIPQVILQLARLLHSDPRFAAVRFVSAEEPYLRFLAPLGVPRDRVEFMGRLPGPLGAERFHGLFSSWRYRRIARDAALIIHPELRTFARVRAPQMILYYDFIIFEAESIGGRRKWSRWLWYAYKNRLAARARFKAAISGHTRKRALELFPKAAEGGIEVLHLGARSAVRGDGKPKDLGPGPIRFLYVGSFEARKNIDALIENLPVVLGGLDAQVDLAGHLGPARRADLEARIAATGLAGKVRLPGLVDDATLADLYTRAHFLVFPTLFEGFGLPMVEAMGYGAVVCAFDNSCIAEVGGGALVLREDNDFAGWGTEIRALVADPSRYAERSRLSLERAAHFSEEGMLGRYGDYLAKAIAAVEAR
jgi:glycosyltransferase involved in cell wall biosynthesis